MGRYRYLAGLILLLAVTATADLTTWDNGDSGATIRAAIQANDAEFSAFKNAIDTDDDESIADEDVVVGSLTAAGVDGERRIEFGENTSPITPDAGTVGLTNSGGTLQYYNDDGILRDVGSDAPTFQTSDPTIADTTGWYFNTTDWDLFWNTYGVRTVNVQARTLDDSDTTDPVLGTVSSDPTTHDGTGTSVTVSVASITETYEASRQYRIWNTTDDALTEDYQSFTGLSFSDTLPADTDSYRFDLLVTDLAGNTGTGNVAVGYSGGANCPSGAYYFAWDANATDGTNYACLNNGGSTVEGTVTGGTISGIGGYFEKDAITENIAWASDPYDDECTIWMTVYVATTTNYSTLFEMYGAGGSQIYGRVDSSNRAMIYYNDGSLQSSFSGDNYTDSVAVRIGFTWSVSGDAFGVAIGTGSWELDTGEGLTSLDSLTTPTVFYIGDTTNVGSSSEDVDTVRISDVFIVKSYQASDPDPL